MQLFDDERSAFAAVAETFNRYTLLIDTYDTRRGIQNAVEVARRAHRESWARPGRCAPGQRRFPGRQRVRARPCWTRRGCARCRILGSGDLDEYSISELVAANAPIDGFGVGTSLGVGGGSLEHDVEGGRWAASTRTSRTWTSVIGEPKIKVAGPKSTWPGRKEVYRLGNFERDLITLDNEPAPEQGIRLLKPVIRSGTMIPGSLPPVSEIWEFAQANLRELPERYQALIDAPTYPVEYSPALMALRDNVVRRHTNGAAHGNGQVLRDEHA